MKQIKPVLAELRGALGGYGFVQPETSGSEVAENQSESKFDNTQRDVADFIADGLVAKLGDVYDDALISLARVIFGGYTNTGTVLGNAEWIRRKLTQLREKWQGDRYAEQGIDALLAWLPPKSKPEDVA